MCFEDKNSKSFCNCLSVREKKKSFEFSYYQNSSMLKASVKDGLTYSSLQGEYTYGIFAFSGSQICAMSAGFPLGHEPFPIWKPLIWHCTDVMEVQCKGKLYYC